MSKNKLFRINLVCLHKRLQEIGCLAAFPILDKAIFDLGT